MFVEKRTVASVFTSIAKRMFSGLRYAMPFSPVAVEVSSAGHSSSRAVFGGVLGAVSNYAPRKMGGMGGNAAASGRGQRSATARAASYVALNAIQDLLGETMAGTGAIPGTPHKPQLSC